MISDKIAIVYGSESYEDKVAYLEKILASDNTLSVRYKIGYGTPEPEDIYTFINTRNKHNIIIAFDHGSTFVPSMIAALTPNSTIVIGIPLESNLDKVDSLLTMLSMPSGSNLLIALTVENAASMVLSSHRLLNNQK